MTIVERINADLKTAMLSKDEKKLPALRLIRAEVLKKEKEKVGTVLTDDQVLGLLQSMAKQRRDSIEQYRNANRADLIEREQQDLAVISAYMPAALSEEEIDAIVGEAIAKSGASSAKDMGKVMGPLMAALKATGKSYDGSAINGKVKAKLGG